MSELRAGGLAMIIGLKNSTQYNGKCVKTSSVVRYGEEYTSPASDQKYKHSSPGFSWVVVGDITNPMGEHGWGTLNPKNLMPIDGHDFTEEEREKEKVL